MIFHEPLCEGGAPRATPFIGLASPILELGLGAWCKRDKASPGQQKDQRPL